jgi:mRNA-degrading endonuclease RelE of RelBE toxin-antitoxin system
MPEIFRLLPTSRFKRDVEEVYRHHPAILQQLESLKVILTHDPYNRSRRHDIQKLRDVPNGEGQYRIRSGRYRLRYDVSGSDIVLYSFKHRKEAY